MNNTRKAFTAESIFNGTDMLQHHAVIIENGIIEALIPLVSLNSDVEVIDFGNTYITPAFIDIQLYGANGRLLSVFPDAQTVGDIATYCKNSGTHYCMPTVATNTYEVIFKCIDAIRDYWKGGGKGVLGLHVEGPWISKEKRGAHREEWIFSPTVKQAKELLDYGKDIIKLITLAPEECSEEVIRLIREQNIFVSGGHSNASYSEAYNAFNNGVELATHLYNAMSPLQHRAPGFVGAVFNHHSVRSSIVADGHHVDFEALKIAKQLMGERLFVITDAVTETTEGYYTHTFEGDKYTANGILSGSCLTMNKAVHNLVHKAGIPVEEAIRMCSLYPARAIKFNDETGMIKKGYRADLIVMDKEFNVLRTDLN